ncbi:MAG: nucleotidyltransferase domain-containing protein [Deltaproteobacteria bacterium]|nr:nucleotidyltransferase domain-containing protein [Deltaproteobacteria bacterium]
MPEPVHVDGLGGVDPTRVPLPHGTQVTTAVERGLDDGGHIRAGAVGTVVALLPGDRLRVRVVGRGEHEFERAEVRPVSRGQVRFAVARARDEAALSPCVVLTATVGSRAWGLADEGSDHDTRGVFVLPFGWREGLTPAPEVVVSADGSHTRWEVERTVRQALRADPNTLEMLFVPTIAATDPMGEWIIAARSAFVSQAIYGAFGRYALAQAKRLRQSLRLAEHRTLVLEWLRADPGASLDAVALRLAEATGDGAESPHHKRARQYLKQLYRSLYDQGLLAENSFAGLASMARAEAPQLSLPRELRPKNAYNLLRIVDLAVHWLATGEPRFVATGQLAQRLRAIKSGDVPLSTALDWTEQRAAQLDEARLSSPLPSEPDLAAADAVLQAVRAEVARRFVGRGPGPFGRDAPPPPPPRQQQQP